MLSAFAGPYGPPWRYVCLLALLALAACSSGKSKDTPAQCTDTCASLSHECGTVCGQACGSCGSDSEGHALTCAAGLCRCVPTCDATTCGGGDGCGGSCPCAADVTCLDCGLRLVRVAQDGSAGTLNQITIALEWNGRADGPLPRLADIRLAADAGFELESVRVHEPLTDARKLLYRYVGTNQPWRKNSDGTYQLMIHPGARNEPIRPGRWLTLTFKNPTQRTGDASFRLLRLDQTVAPAEANAVIGGEQFGQALVIHPAS